jgi:Predicted ATPase (AAA+ superfamily)
VVVLFDLLPKEDRNDLFDREEELNKLKGLEGLYSPITLVLGFRRTGKSSLIKVALKELGLPSIYIDLRRFEEIQYVQYRDFVLRLQHEVNKLIKRFPDLLNALRNIRGVSIMGNQVLFYWKAGKRVSFASLLDSLNDWADDKVIVVLDEAQELIRMRGFNILPILAYSYDNLRKIRFIISGSKMGLLYRFLKIQDPDSPLFGRAMSTIELKPFNQNETREFLKLGFSQFGINFKDYDEVYREIGGIPGWLTYFGFKYVEYRDLDRALSETVNHAIKLIKAEFRNFLLDKLTTRRRYYTIMQAVAKCSTWSEIKRTLQIREGVEISDSRIHNYLRQLMDSSWIVKIDNKYCTPEPLISKAFLKSANNHSTNSRNRDI